MPPPRMPPNAPSHIYMALTDTALRQAKPTEKARRISDAKGLYIEISPSGGKLWRLKYRFDKKEKRLSLGVYPEVSLAQARKDCDAARELLAQGIDPGAEKGWQEKSRSRVR